MILTDLVTQRFNLEGRTYAEPPQIDQPTGPGGITLPVLSAYRGRQMTVNDLKAMTIMEASAIMMQGIQTDLQRYHFDQIDFEPLRVQMLDYSWNSGPERAVRWLQRTLGMPKVLVTGQIDARTIATLRAVPGPLLPAINNALAAERAHSAWHGGVENPSFQDGVAHRAIDFVIVLA